MADSFHSLWKTSGIPVYNGSIAADPHLAEAILRHIAIGAIGIPHI